MQLEKLKSLSIAAPTWVSLPLLIKSSEVAVITSSQTLTHRPHRMHFESSLIIAGLDWSRRGFIFLPRIRRSLILSSSERRCSSQFRFRSQYRQSSGWFDKSNSTIVLRAVITRGECVLIFIHSSTGCEQAVTRRSRPSTSTTHILQAPVGVNSFILQSVGIIIPLRLRAERIVSPFSALIFLLFTCIVNSMKVIAGCWLLVAGCWLLVILQ